MRGKLELGVIDLWYKDHSPGKSGTSFDNSRGYSKVEEPSGLQKAIVEIVNEELGKDWIFRQIRDWRNRESLEDNQLYRGPATKPLILVYQRGELIPQRREPIAQKELESSSDRGLEEAVERINAVLPERYSLQKAYGQYEEWHIDGEGSGVNTNILLVCFYFRDKAEKIQALRNKLKRSERALKRASSGPVQFDGKDLSKRRLKSLHKRISKTGEEIARLEREYS